MMPLSTSEKAMLCAASHDVERESRGQQSRIVAFSLAGKWASLSNGHTIPITNMFDVEQEETDDPDLCVTMVAGPDEESWFAVRVDCFDLAAMD